MMAWLVRLDAEMDNLRAALDWAFETDPRRRSRCAWGSIPTGAQGSSGREGVDRSMQAVDVARTWRMAGAPSSIPNRSALAARVLSRAAQMQASYTGRRADPALGEEATAMARESGDSAVLADSLVTLAYARVAVDGSILPSGPEGEAAVTALALAEERGDWYRASIIAAAFAIGESTGDPASTEAWLERATEAARRTGNVFALGNVVGVSGRVAVREGRLADAERWLIEARALYRAMGDRGFERVVASELAHVLRRDGRLDEAEAEYRQTILDWQQSGNRGAVANQLECFGLIALARGQGARAARLLGAAEALREAGEAPMTDFERAEYDAAVGRLRAELDAGDLGSAWSEGRLTTADAAVAFALSQ